ncbi:MAG: hypothetical protein OXF72_05645 [Gammaproteobacteria bacterium]|nr:hypothetical protein [Gammaproteobacteria bacterium]MCY4323419.1 hypothetical protein [Gammaproteobacteria bacterium]
MEQDMIAVLALGVAIFSLMLVQFRGLRAEMVKMRDDHSADLAKMRDDHSADLAKMRDDLSTQIGNLRERMAHLEGLMEGLREAVTGARKAA